MFNRKLENDKGFTLVEIISTVIILSIILLIAVPAIGNLLNGFRTDYYKKLQKTVKTSGQDYINDNRRLRPSGVFESYVITTKVLETDKKIDKVVDYRKKACSNTSYAIVIKTADKKYQYESCLSCPEDSYTTTLKDRPYCHPAWKNNDNISIELSTPPKDIYIPINANMAYIREKLGIKKQIVKKDSSGKIIAALTVDDEDVILPENINGFVGTTAVSGQAIYNYGGKTIQTNVHIFQNEAPKVTMTNIRNGTPYTAGTWTSGVRVILAANDEYFNILNLKISEYQVYDVAKGTWTKITSCPAESTSCTINYNTTMVRNYRYRIIVAGGSTSKITAAYSFKIDASVPNCNINMIDGSGGAYTGAYINTNQVTIRYSADDPQYEGLPLSSMSKAELYITSSNPNEPVVTQTLTANVAPWRTIHTITDEGSYSIMLKCYDTVGNYNTASANINILRDISVKFYSPTSTTLYATTTYQYNKALGTLPTPARTGHTFQGWFTTPTTGGTKAVATTVLTTTSNTYSLFARWTANIYTLTYNSNGGTTVTNPTSYTYGVGVSSFTNPTRTGYRFAGWHDGTSVKASITATDLGNKTLTAQWTANTYTIVYNGAGNTSGTMANTKCTYNATCTLRANAFVRTGNNFMGWSLTNGGVVAHNNSATVSNLSSTHNATINLYAIWSRSSYTITYNLNGGTNPSTNPGSYTYGDTITFASPTRTGYRFDGWYKEAAFTNRVTGITATGTGAVVVYAKWLANTYFIDYAANGATSGTMARTTCTYGTGCTLRTNTFARTDYRFNNWSSGGKTYADLANVTNLTATHNGVITMTANWVQRVNYIYLLHGFSGGTSNLYGFGTQSINMNANAPYYLDTAGYVDATAQANGYSLATYVYPAAGWTWSTRTLISGLAPNKYNGVYFTAPETQEYRVTSYMFPNGGTRLGTVTWSGSTLYQDQTFQQGSIWKTVDTGTNITVPAVAAARTGYSFTGWLGENGTIYNASNVVGMTAALAGTDLNFVFRAQWLGNPYTVSFNANGGTGTMAALNCRIGQTCTLPAEAYTNNCYKFDGWATSAAGAVVYSDRATVALTANVTLYAKWSANYVNNTTTCAACSVSCGGGTQTCTVTKKDTATGVACPASLNTSYSQACNTQSCCSSVTTSYGAWGACSASCGGGTQTRSVTTKSTYNGATCSTSTQSQACNTQTCLVEPNATIYAQQLTTCVNGVYFYTTQAQNPSRWITTEMTVHWVISGAVVATYYGDLAGTNPGGFGPWYAYNFGAPPPAPATTSGYYVTRHTELYFRLKGKIATTGAAIINQSGYGGCSV